MTQSLGKKKHLENSLVKGIGSWCLGCYLLKVHSNTAQRYKSGSEERSTKSEQKCDFSEVTGTTSWNWMCAQNIGINTPALACQCPKILQALPRKSLTGSVGPNAIWLALLQLHCSACSLQGWDWNSLFFLQCLTLILVEVSQATGDISVTYARTAFWCSTWIKGDLLYRMTAQEGANFQLQFKRKHKFTPWECQVQNTRLELTSGRKRANFKFLNAVRISVSFNFK